ncbi:glutathione peroxidase [Clostridium felsineum]|uniref:Glutathione peroxidase n=1 Tax=Clostridium felsineum TaxID=36839 RepID=A0A1S8LBB8_9CLOT|nr:glutathione peroxidase [Clostridium felsineum]MCR3760656.1 glutathione peroxidase [Clostridium felsineum]URZ00423.1 Hydroperoxy fatty acid reductase gpx1 [Clostridium felsineum]URZ06937.1 Hydroperoxy fatty acid reductase gpx1 [Clostridium felsineum]URZ11969.1 Hydroperoxy fatty acid reductase gpx1 [Clostridium felsineum]URZ16504.1 Hydroperoxy fatty acid reductase gpx1 [Clostridium felsineum DSM 794]
MSVYDFKAKTIEGKEVSLEEYKGKVLVIVNTASKCGFTPQYEGLEELYKEYKDRGFEILGFPSNQFAEQEPGNNDEVKNFCKINYGVTFQLFEKGDVRGENAQPLFKYLTENAPFKGFNMEHKIGKTLLDVLEKNFPSFLEGDSVKWNFTKFLIDKEGNVVKRFEPTSEPKEIASDIEKLL